MHWRLCRGRYLAVWRWISPDDLGAARRRINNYYNNLAINIALPSNADHSKLPTRIDCSGAVNSLRRWTSSFRARAFITWLEREKKTFLVYAQCGRNKFRCGCCVLHCSAKAHWTQTSILYTYKKRLSAKQILLAVAVSHWLKFAVVFWVVAFGKNFLLKRTSLKFKGPLLVHSASSAVEALYGYL